MTFGEEMQAKLLKRYLQMRKTLFRWNFEKFLVNHQGQPVRRYDESLDPSELVSILKKETKSHLPPRLFQVPDIDVLLGQCELDLAS